MEDSAKALEGALRKSLAVIQQLKAQLAEADDRAAEPIAVVGLSCRFPGGADSPEAYWDALAGGVDARREIPADRWPWQRFYDADPSVPGTHYVRHGSFLDCIDEFDPDFFGISQREADALDPQHRLLLEVSWEALERAGIAAEQLRHSQTGVYVGIGQNDYAQLRMFGGRLDRISPYDGTGSSFCFSAARLSYVLGLHGPSMAIDTACSSSLVALHLACQALRNGECAQALAGGVHLVISPEVTVYLSRIQALSPDGRSRAFAAGADGYGRGEGCGMLVLKRLRDARRDGDAVLAVIRGSAVNHDGPSSGLTVPSGLAQERLLREALERARLSPDEIDWIEAHGTGTVLGDPIELAALASVFPRQSRNGRPLFVSSVKTNIGHLEAASGIAGVIKVILAMQHRALPAHLHFDRPNPNIDWAETPFAVPTRLTPWESDRPRAAGVSAFGLGGTNAHIIVAEAPVGGQVVGPAHAGPHDPSAGPWPLPLSATTPGALAALRDRYAAFLDGTDLPFSSIAAAAATRRNHFAERLVVVAASAAEAAAQLRALPLRPAAGERAQPRVAFVFSGQGAQYAGMAAPLYQSSPVFRAVLDACAALVEREAGWSPLPLLLDAGEGSRIDETEFTQPALFTLQHALVSMWRALGVEPAIVWGHSIGEFAAAWTAGVLSLEDAVRLVVARGRLMQRSPGRGGMAALLMTEADARARLAPYGNALTVAAVNGPRAVAIAGERAALDRCLAALEHEGAAFKRLPVSHAFHSPQMGDAREAFRALMHGIPLHPAAVPMITTGAAAGDGDVTSAAYWADQITNPVRFADASARVAREHPDVVLEIGPSGSHLALARQSAPGLEAAWLPSLQPGSRSATVETVARLYERGCGIRWRQVFPGAAPVLLPTYPFQRRRCWVDVAVPKSAAGSTYRVEARLSAGQPVLRDHRVRGAVVFPAAGFVEAALSGAAEQLGTADLTLERVEFLRPLTIRGADVTLQTLVEPSDAGVSVRIRSRAGDGTWVEHMSCSAARLAGAIQPLTIGGDAVRTTTGDAFYAASAARGIDYGPAFRVLTGLQAHGDGSGAADFAAPALSRGEYRAHPVLIDAALQALAASQPASDEFTYVPAGIDRLDVAGPLPDTGRIACRTVRLTAETASCDATLMGASGAVSLRLSGIRMRRLEASGLRDGSLPITWSPEWEAIAVPAPPAAGAAPPCVVVRDDLTAALAETQRLLRLPDAARPRLLLVTRGAQSVAGPVEADAVQSATLWGFGRVVRNEAPQLRCTCIDLDPLATDEECEAALAIERALDDEDQVAWRHGVRYARRLRPFAAASALPASPMALACAAPGDLGTLAFGTAEAPRPPGEGQLRVRVRAAGINFKDVLHAVGALPMPEGGGFGFDAAGVVEAVGGGVDRFAVGDRVMLTLTPGSLASAVVAAEPFVCRLPDALTFAEGAGLPLPYLTAWHALVHLARVRPGDRVLIHAAAGGVGQAAIQVARAMGAEVLATAHPSKHRFLRQQGVVHVFNSRDASFANGVRGVTHGHGADVVLNSLAGPLIEAGIDCTAPGGRFVEIGKIGIWSHDDVARRRPDVEYLPFDLADVARESPERIRGTFDEVASRLGETLAPLRVRAFAAADVVDAFRLLSRARHVGRVVVMLPAGQPGSADGVQLITGGFGALGRGLARELASGGARKLAFVSPAAPDDERAAWMGALRDEGIDVRAYASTLSSRQEAERVLAAAEAEFGEPVRGVYHLAGVLADATIAAQTGERLGRAIDAKLTSARSLHEATRTRDLDRFVLFSSAAALLGTPGQGNYAAANAGLDALAAARRAEGLPALSINWGPWRTAGMAARLADTDRERMAAAGVLPLEEAPAWNAMRDLLDRGCAQAAVIDADWTRLAARMPDASLLRSMQAPAAIAATHASEGAVVGTVAALEPAQRRGAIARYLESRVAAVLGRPEGSEVPHARGFFTLGMDSLTSLELRNRLEKELGLPLPATITLEYGSVELLSGYLAAVHPAWAPPSRVDDPVTTNALADLSEAELAALLAKELGA